MLCDICNKRVSHYKNKGDWYPIDYYKCNNCHAQQRQMLMWNIYNELKPKLGTMLYLSPSKCLEDKWKPLADEYISADHPPRVSNIIAMAQMDVDLTDTPFEDEKFDFIVLSHVIDQIKDEESAIKELHRIVKQDGMIFLVVPMYWAEKTKELEKEQVLSHWRRCGCDYPYRYTKLFNLSTYKDVESLFVLTKKK